MNKPVRTRLASPRGTAVFPSLNTPDTKFDAVGVYSTGLRLDKSDPDAQAFLASIEEFAAKHVGEKAKMPIKDETDDAGNPKGTVIVNFKVKAVWPKSGESRQPTLVDGAKKPFEGSVGGGSVIRVAAEMSTYEGFGGGVTLAPLAVQVIEARSYSPALDAFDMETEDDGAEAASGFDGTEEF